MLLCVEGGVSVMNWVEYKGCIAQVTTCPREEQRVTDSEGGSVRNT